jgi:phage-related protein
MAFKMKKATIYKLVDGNKKKTLGDVKKGVKKELGYLKNFVKDAITPDISTIKNNAIGVVDGLKNIAGAVKRGAKVAKEAKAIKK